MKNIEFEKVYVFFPLPKWLFLMVESQLIWCSWLDDLRGLYLTRHRKETHGHCKRKKKKESVCNYSRLLTFTNSVWGNFDGADFRPKRYPMHRNQTIQMRQTGYFWIPEWQYSLLVQQELPHDGNVHCYCGNHARNLLWWWWKGIHTQLKAWCLPLNYLERQMQQDICIKKNKKIKCDWWISQYCWYGTVTLLDKDKDGFTTNPHPPFYHRIKVTGSQG